MSNRPQAAGRPSVLAQQKLPTRDGVELCTDIFLPDTEAPGPAIVVRTPYGRSEPFLLRLALRLKQAGFATALQDCRGRYKSSGELDWLKEEDDTYDTLAWLGKQDFCDGRVGLIGMSISSHPCFAVAAKSPPPGIRIEAFANIMGVMDFYSLFYHQDALLLHWALPWTHAMAGRKMPARMDTLRPWEELYRNLPLAGVEEGELDLGFWRQVVAHPSYDDYWRKLDASRWLPEIETPTLHVAGWYDFLLSQSVRAYEEIVAGRQHAAGRQKLVIGPWDHQSLFAGGGGAGSLDLQSLLSVWFERWLGDGERRGPVKALEREPDVMLYAMGAGHWLDLDAWPGSGSLDQDWYLTSGSSAQSAGGDGGLLARPAGAGSDRFRYDPSDPVPTAGGAIWPFACAGLEPGRVELSAVEARDDVLVYTSSTLEEDLVILGRVQVELWASSSASDTDFTARLADVDPEGVPWAICEGIARARFDQPSADGESAPGDPPRRLSIDLRATGQCFRRGHRLRLEISSSSFPQYARSLNGDPSGATVAEQTVFHGGELASRLRFHTLAPQELAARRRVPLEVQESDAGPAERLTVAARSWGSDTLRRFNAYICRQFGKPEGLFGRLVSQVLVTLNRDTNRWTVEQLDVQPEDRTLEIGFGPGYAIREVAKRAVHGKAVGLDHSQLMVNTASRRNASAIRDGRVDLRLGALADLELEEEAFDKVYAVNSVQIWPEPVASMKKLRRVLKPGGLIALTLRPSWVRTEQQVRQLGIERINQLRAAGFADARLEIELSPGVATFCALAVKPAG